MALLGDDRQLRSYLWPSNDEIVQSIRIPREHGHSNDKELRLWELFDQLDLKLLPPQILDYEKIALDFRDL